VGAEGVPEGAQRAGGGRVSIVTKAFACPECGTLVKQGPRGRSQGCVHFPPRDWGWSASTISLGLQERRGPEKPGTPEARAVVAKRRRIEALREPDPEKEVWDE